MNFFTRKEPIIDQHAVDMDELAQRLTPADRLPAAPQLPTEYAPRKQYSLDMVASFLTRHITDLDQTLKSLDQEAAALEDDLAHVRRQREVTSIAREVLFETSGKLIDRSVELGRKYDRPDYVKPEIREVSAEEAGR